MFIDQIDGLFFNPTFGREGSPFNYRPREHHKGVVRKVKKVVKKVVSSPIGKIALAAAAIYTGGAALGAWGGTAAAGAGVAGQSAAAAAGKAALLGSSSGVSLASIASGAKTALSALSVVNSLSGGEREQIVQDYGPQIAALRRAEAQQAESLKIQEEEVTRARTQADQQEADLSLAAASQKNAVLSRRRGRGGLAFSGPVTGLKTTYGG